jgi:hypothetical protein
MTVEELMCLPLMRNACVLVGDKGMDRTIDRRVLASDDAADARHGIPAESCLNHDIEGRAQ